MTGFRNALWCLRKKKLTGRAITLNLRNYFAEPCKIIVSWLAFISIVLLFTSGCSSQPTGSPQAQGYNFRQVRLPGTADYEEIHETQPNLLQMLSQEAGMQQISALESAAEPTANLVLDEGVKLYCYPYRELLWLIQEGELAEDIRTAGRYVWNFPVECNRNNGNLVQVEYRLCLPGEFGYGVYGSPPGSQEGVFPVTVAQRGSAEESYTYRYASVAEDADGTLGFLFDPAGLETLLQENGLEQAEYLIPVQVSNSPGGEFTLLYIAPGQGSADDYVVLYGADLTGWENGRLYPAKDFCAQALAQLPAPGAPEE